MVYTRFVQVGRVVLMEEGEHKGKLAVICEIVDHNRVLVDGPSTNVPRHAASVKQMILTDFVLERFPRGAKSKTVQRKFDAQGIIGKWTETEMAKRIAKKERRAQLTDFERFKVMVLQKKRARMVRA